VLHRANLPQTTVGLSVQVCFAVDPLSCEFQRPCILAPTHLLLDCAALAAWTANTMPVVTSASTISFPSNLSDNPISPQLTDVYPSLPSISNESSYERTSRSSLRASALEVHDLVWLASSRNVQGRLNQLYESNAGRFLNIYLCGS
jgi:hypothetical protein